MLILIYFLRKVIWLTASQSSPTLQNLQRNLKRFSVELNYLITWLCVDDELYCIDHNKVMDWNEMRRAQVVGWPPVRSFRKNMLAVQKSVGEESEKNSSSPNASFVKVSMDGAPYLRKVDLKMYKSYRELSDSLGTMFSSFTIGK